MDLIWISRAASPALSMAATGGRVGDLRSSSADAWIEVAVLISSRVEA